MPQGSTAYIDDSGSDEDIPYPPTPPKASDPGRSQAIVPTAPSSYSDPSSDSSDSSSSPPPKKSKAKKNKKNKKKKKGKQVAEGRALGMRVPEPPVAGSAREDGKVVQSSKLVRSSKIMSRGVQHKIASYYKMSGEQGHNSSSHSIFEPFE